MVFGSRNPEVAVRAVIGLRRRRCAALCGWSRLSSQAEELHERTEAQTLVWTSSERGERDAPGAATHALAGDAAPGAGARPLISSYISRRGGLSVV